MQFSHTLVAAYLFGTAFAGYNVNQAPAQANGGVSGGSARLRTRDSVGPVPCSDNSQCQGLDYVIDDSVKCIFQANHDFECWNGYCQILNRDPWALMECLYPTVSFDDACNRGNPGSGDYIAIGVAYCDSTTGNGNAGCDTEDDACLSS